MAAGEEESGGSEDEGRYCGCEMAIVARVGSAFMVGAVLDIFR